MNKITCICMGVKDMSASIHFYRDKLGFHTDETSDHPPVIFFDTPGTKFELFPLDQLLFDIGDPTLHAGEGFGGITLAYNVAKREEVDKVIALAKAAGATIVKAPQEVFWGGYHAYFKDLDGYCWEVAWGPDFHYDENGLLVF